MTRPWKFALAFLALGAFIIVAAFGVLVWAGWRESRVPGRTVLEVDFSAPYLEQRPEGPFGAVFDRRMRLRDVVEALHAAAADSKVVGLVARVSPEATGLAGIEELRDAVAAFRASGKPAIAWTDTLGEVTPANGSSYPPPAFYQIYIRPSGDVGLTGLELTSLFRRGTLDKIGVEPQFAQRYEYKNAPNTFTETAFTPAHRESMDELAGSIFDHMVAEIAKARKIAPEGLRAAIDHGPLLADEAMKAKLVDGLL